MQHIFLHNCSILVLDLTKLNDCQDMPLYKCVHDYLATWIECGIFELAAVCNSSSNAEHRLACPALGCTPSAEFVFSAGLVGLIRVCCRASGVIHDADLKPGRLLP